MDSTTKKTNMLYGLIGLLVLAISIGAWAIMGPSESTQQKQMSGIQELQAGPVLGSGVKITVYKSQSCGCCGGYVQYLQDSGFDVEVVVTKDMDAVKEKYKIPQDVWSCHTAVMGEYFIEGHVPVEAIQKLAVEKPALDGIALPGMPAGSPGMGGMKQGPFGVVSLKGNSESLFVEV